MKATSLVSIPDLDTSNVKYMNSLFAKATSVEEINSLNAAESVEEIPPFNTENLNSMDKMFTNAFNLKEVPFFNIKKVTDVDKISDFLKGTCSMSDPKNIIKWAELLNQRDCCK